MQVLRVIRVLVAILLKGVAIGLVAVVGLRLAFPLPDISQRADSTARAADPASRFGAIFAEGAATHPGRTGIHPLTDGREALGSRLFLVERAEVSIDAQYYIWLDDISGRLLLRALYAAAERGVRVRLLLDDNGIPGMDDIFAALNAHPDFEVRLFNPSTVRRPKLLGYAFSFARMNRRMHNKALIVDGAAAIVGGRNIGDPYFQIGAGNVYVDADVLGVGAVVPETQAAFDAYWNSGSAYELERLVAGSGDLAAFLATAEAAAASEDGADFLAAMAVTEAQLEQGGRDRLEWTQARLFVDDPAKGLGQAEREALLATEIRAILEAGEDRIDLVSAYFVPGGDGRDLFAKLAAERRGLTVQTNALTTTDVLMVHAGYAKYRRALLESGVRLMELKPVSGSETGEIDVGPLAGLGVSGASLHAKTFAVDGARVFVGSFNFDPRSVRLNCEMGFLIESPTLAARLQRYFDTELPDISYTPELTDTGQMVWREVLEDGSEVIHQTEPGATLLKRVALRVIGWLPVEWLL